jgi:hypothetical protein
MQEHVGIAVAERLPVVRDGDATEHEPGAGAEPVRVVSKADAKHAA